MLHLSHGWIFVALMLGLVLGNVWLDGRIRRRMHHQGRPVTLIVPAIETLVFLAIYAALRIQPARMGGDPFHFVLGVFDGITVMGAILPFLVHRLRHEPRQTKGVPDL